MSIVLPEGHFMGGSKEGSRQRSCRGLFGSSDHSFPHRFIERREIFNAALAALLVQPLTAECDETGEPGIGAGYCNQVFIHSELGGARGLVLRDQGIQVGSQRPNGNLPR